MLKVSDLRLKYPSGQRKIFDHLNITIQDKENEKVLLLVLLVAEKVHF